jgi:tetratricopeptide (TPR) repeat protein
MSGATIDPLLAALGHPEADPAQPALTALHQGAAQHRLALILETVQAYRRSAALEEGDLACLPLLERAAGHAAPRATAEAHYRAAIAADPRLAEAWFGLGRLRQYAVDGPAAVEAFERALGLPPHPRAPGHALLHANAHWHLATLAEDAGRDEAALEHYRRAVAKCDNFGVHHVRYALCLRRCGRAREAIPHFERMMTYSHRYFTEFVLPPLQPPAAAAPPPATLDVLHETGDGALVVFWNNLYWALPRSMVPVTADQLARAGQTGPAYAGRGLGGLLGRLGFRRATAVPALRSATSIAEFEVGGDAG